MRNRYNLFNCVLIATSLIWMVSIYICIDFIKKNLTIDTLLTYSVGIIIGSTVLKVSAKLIARINIPVTESLWGSIFISIIPIGPSCLAAYLFPNYMIYILIIALIFQIYITRCYLIILSTTSAVNAHISSRDSYYISAITCLSYIFIASPIVGGILHFTGK
jgi:hypothetical protein